MQLKSCRGDCASRCFQAGGAERRNNGQPRDAANGWEAPRLMDHIGQRDLAATGQWILHSDNNEQTPIAEKNLRVQVRFGNWARRSPDHQVDLARPQFAQRGVKIRLHNVERYLRMPAVQPLDDGWHDSRGQWSVLPIRTSPVVGSARDSMSCTLCLNSSKTTRLRLMSARP